MQQGDAFVVQEYLREPYLLDNLKFDMRIYVLMLSCDPLKIFLFNEGIVRFATQEYKQPTSSKGNKGDESKSNLANMFVHLTNYSLNKDNAEFKNASTIDDETAHKRSLTKVLS